MTNPLAVSERGTCDAPQPIPDGVPEGIRLGPIEIEGDGTLEHLGLRLEISHSSTADVGIRLYYDMNNDGSDDIGIPMEIHLGKRHGWTEEEPYSCPQEMDGTFYFGGNPSGDSPFAVLRGVGAGGAFSLVVTDTLATETGVVHSWSLRRVPVGPTGPRNLKWRIR